MELNGRQVAPAELAALGLYNYGHFTSMRVEDGRVRGLGLHLERLANDCRAVFDAALDPERVRELVRHVVQPLPSPVVARVTVYAPDLELGHPDSSEPQILVTTRPVPPSGELPPLRVQAVHYDRDLPGVKHIGLFGSVYRRRQTQAAGFDDVLFVGAADRVTEGATWNIAFLEGRRVTWPEADWLPGVTMRLVQAALPSLGLESVTVPVTVSELNRFEGAFITNAGVGVRAVSAIDQVSFAGSAVIEDIQAAYLAITGETL